MLILHTSDWHLGRTLHGVDLLDHQRVYVDHLVELVRERSIDVVLVSGDVYDRAVPSVPAVQLLSSALARLSELVTVIVTPGNHDSAVRLGFASGLLRDRVQIRASVDDLAVPVVVDDETGPVAFYGLPYLDPDSVRARLVPDDERAKDPAARLPRSHAAVMGAALDRVRADLATRPGTRAVVLAHAFVVGGAPSDSERDIRVGGVDSVPADLFHGLDYVALGHLHGAQGIAAPAVAPADEGSPRVPVIRYSGSPLAFSFGEKHQVKSSALVRLAADGEVDVELVPTPVPRRLSEITGDLAELLDGRHDDLADDWLRVFVTDPVHPPGLHALVRERFPHALSIQHVPRGAVRSAERRAVPVDADPVEVAREFVAFATGAEPSDAEIEVLRAAYEAAGRAELSD